MGSSFYGEFLRAEGKRTGVVTREGTLIDRIALIFVLINKGKRNVMTHHFVQVLYIHHTSLTLNYYFDQKDLRFHHV